MRRLANTGETGTGNGVPLSSSCPRWLYGLTETLCSMSFIRTLTESRRGLKRRSGGTLDSLVEPAAPSKSHGLVIANSTRNSPIGWLRRKRRKIPGISLQSPIFPLCRQLGVVEHCTYSIGLNRADLFATPLNHSCRGNSCRNPGLAPIEY